MRFCFMSRRVEPDRQYFVNEAQKEIFALQGLNEGVEYNFYNTPLTTLPGHLSTFEGGWDNKDVLVMLHGYAGSNAFWFKMFPSLLTHFHVYAFDLYGFGASYRPKLDIKTPEEAIEIYTRSIEEWRQNLNLKDFYICGHSMGAFLTNHYLHRYGETGEFKIQGVFMLSPAGSTLATNVEKEKFLQKYSWFKARVMQCISYLVFEARCSPMNTFFLCANKSKFLRKTFNAPDLGFTKEESEVFLKYYLANLEYGAQGMGLLGFFIDYGRHSKIPWDIFINDLVQKYNYVFIYGDKDWMDPSNIIKMMESFPADNKCQVIQIVPQGGHMMPLECPTGTADVIKEFHQVFRKRNENPLQIILDAEQIIIKSKREIAQGYIEPGPNQKLKKSKKKLRVSTSRFAPGPFTAIQGSPETP